MDGAAVDDVKPQADVLAASIAALSIGSPVAVSPAASAAPAHGAPRTGLAYDERMCQHCVPSGSHPEQPDRIVAIYKQLVEQGIAAECMHVETRPATDEELETVHEKRHVEDMNTLPTLKKKERNDKARGLDSIYFNEHSSTAARLAVGALLEVTHKVVTGECSNGIAVIRPPGHHAEAHTAMGFCLYNNVAVAAKMAVEKWGLSRVMILDWDVHHGNGTQHMFEQDERVFYVSLHRYDEARFYPHSTDAGPAEIGKGKGKGYNCNIAFNGGSGMGDPEYLAAFTHCVVPLAMAYQPELILISAGFDAAVNDPLGGYCITTRGYARMTKLLSAVCDGKVVIALEGGYNLDSISSAMAACANVLIGRPLPKYDAPLPAPQKRALECINETITALRPHWPCLIRLDLSEDDLVPQDAAPVPMTKFDGTEDTVWNLSNENLVLALASHGREVGPVTAQNRILYEKMLNEIVRVEKRKNQANAAAAAAAAAAATTTPATTAPATAPASAP